MATLSAAARHTLMADLDLPRLSPKDIYGGQLVAAMDRQHPRDLFDVMQLLTHEGITPRIRRSFVVYLASHNRTLHEVLFPTPPDIRFDHERSFAGLTRDHVTLEELPAVWDQLFRELRASLGLDQRHFFRAIDRGEADRSLLGTPDLEHLPAIRWTLQNLERLARTNPMKLRAQCGAGPSPAATRSEGGTAFGVS